MMFGIGLTEFIIVLILAIVFVKPDDWPKLMRKLGKSVRQIKGWNKQIKDQIKDIDAEL